MIPRPFQQSPWPPHHFFALLAIVSCPHGACWADIAGSCCSKWSPAPSDVAASCPCSSCPSHPPPFAPVAAAPARPAGLSPKHPLCRDPLAWPPPSVDPLHWKTPSEAAWHWRISLGPPLWASSSAPKGPFHSAPWSDQLHPVEGSVDHCLRFSRRTCPWLPRRPRQACTCVCPCPASLRGSTKSQFLCPRFAACRKPPAFSSTACFHPGTAPLIVWQSGSGHPSSLSGCLSLW